MKFLIKSKANLYTFYGIIFGLLFPLASSLMESWLQFQSIQLRTILLVQASSPLLWVIDSAPFWLGLFAWFSGTRQDRLLREIKKSKRIQNILLEKSKLLLADYKAARNVQQFFLPDRPDFQPIEIDYIYQPLKAVCGDFLSIKKSVEGGIEILLGDVSGHGISAALINFLTLAHLNKISQKYGSNPAQYLKLLNQELINVIPDNLFLTAIFGILRYENSELIFKLARAGHPYPILWQAESREIVLIKAEGMALGSCQQPDYENISLKLNHDDLVFLFTDGVIEIVNESGQTLGFEGLLNIIKNVCQRELTIKENLKRIMQELNAYRNKVPFKDDKVLIGFKVK